MVVLSSVSNKQNLLIGFVLCFMSAGCPEKSVSSESEKEIVSQGLPGDATSGTRELDIVEARMPRKSLDMAPQSPKAGSDAISTDTVGNSGQQKDAMSGADADLVEASSDSQGETDAVDAAKELPAVAPPATPEAVKEVIKAIGRRVIVDEAALKATASNLGSAEEVMGRLDRMFEQLQVFKRIPMKPERNRLTRALKKYSREMGFELKNMKAEQSNGAVSGIPSTLVGNTKIHYLRAQVRGVIQMEFELSPINIDGLERWVKRLPAGVDRMIEVESVRTREKRFVVKSKAFWFLPEAYPTHFPEILSLLGYLRSEGLTEPLADIRQMASPQKWKSIRTKVAELKQFESAASKTLTTYARANQMEARWKFFEEMAKRIESRGLTELFD